MFHVLLPIDLDEPQALAAAQTVTSLPNAAETVRVTILNVQPKIDVVSEGGNVSSEEWYNETDFPSSVERAKKYLEDAGIAVEKRRAHAEPADAIVETASELDVNRIIMSGRKRTPAGKMLFGSVTQSVILHSDIPVTVVMS